MKSLQTIKILFLLFFTLSITTSVSSQNLEAYLDDVIATEYPQDQPGVSVLVAKDGKTIYKKAFGSANLELNVPSNPNNVYEIGSITKQFTAVAILMLEEQGKLNVEDEITKYIPDYPTKGKTITIHHLLNHTSGIKSYTSMPSFIKNARTDMTPTELIDVFKNEPMDFDPGEKFLYNNSGYILLGHIIEVVSGQSYAEFIQKHIFDKVGMKNSSYGSMATIIPNRAAGYSEDENGFKNADYLSLTLPYAAGSIMSTVDDLLKWQNAISANTLIKRSSLEKAINGSTLNDGEHIPYGYGWGENDIQGSKSIQHSGGIFGYTTMGIFLPKENIYVIALSNCNCGNVGGLAEKIAAKAIGKPYPDPKDAITLNEEQLNKWTGTYAFENNVLRFVTVKDGKIYSQREGSTVMQIYPMTETHFIFDSGTTSYDFYEKDGKKETTFKTTNGTYTGKESDKKASPEKEAITLSPEVLQHYIGKFELQPGFILEVTVKDNQIFTQATGQGQLEIFAESKDKFFLKVIPAQITFNRNEKGDVTGLTLYQGGREMPAKKVD